jgi:hypothetical protein
MFQTENRVVSMKHKGLVKVEGRVLRNSPQAMHGIWLGMRGLGWSYMALPILYSYFHVVVVVTGISLYSGTHISLFLWGAVDLNNKMRIVLSGGNFTLRLLMSVHWNLILKRGKGGNWETSGRGPTVFKYYVTCVLRHTGVSLRVHFEFCFIYITFEHVMSISLTYLLLS